MADCWLQQIPRSGAVDSSEQDIWWIISTFYFCLIFMCTHQLLLASHAPPCNDYSKVYCALIFLSCSLYPIQQVLGQYQNRQISSIKGCCWLPSGDDLVFNSFFWLYNKNDSISCLYGIGCVVELFRFVLCGIIYTMFKYSWLAHVVALYPFLFDC